MFYLLLFFILPAFTIWSLLQLGRGKGSGFAFQWQRAFGWLVLWVAPFPFIDAWLHGTEGYDGGSRIFDWVISLPHSWMVLYGGRSLQEVMALAGYTGDAIVDHLGIFLVLWIFHCIVLTSMVAWLLDRGKRLSSPLVVAFGAYMAANAAMIVWK